MRVLAGLTPIDAGDIQRGTQLQTAANCDFAAWRRQTRYVTQYKVSIPGTPVDLVRRFTAFQSWSATTKMISTTNTRIGGTGGATPPSMNEVVAACRDLLQTWGMI